MNRGNENGRSRSVRFFGRLQLLGLGPPSSFGNSDTTSYSFYRPLCGKCIVGKPNRKRSRANSLTTVKGGLLPGSVWCAIRCSPIPPKIWLSTIGPFEGHAHRKALNEAQPAAWEISNSTSHSRHHGVP